MVTSILHFFLTINIPSPAARKCVQQNVSHYQPLAANQPRECKANPVFDKAKFH